MSTRPGPHAPQDLNKSPGHSQSPGDTTFPAGAQAAINREAPTGWGQIKPSRWGQFRLTFPASQSPGAGQPGRVGVRTMGICDVTLEEQLRQDFADDTAYERLALETIIDPNKPPPGTVFAMNDIRGGARAFGRGLHDSIGGGVNEAFTARFRPLAFGAAYKILDFAIEMTMRLNNEPCPGGRWTFTRKTTFVASRPARPTRSARLG
jgi:hypothetical protein